MERTLIIIKPDAVQRGLTGDVMTRFERKGLKMVGCKMIQLNEAILDEHYAHIADKPFYPGVRDFMMSTPVIAQVWEGVDVVETVRILCGITNARKADAGTIRGDLAMSVQSNIVHASDSTETAEKEVPRFFKDSELHNWNMTRLQHMYGPGESA